MHPPLARPSTPLQRLPPQVHLPAAAPGALQPAAVQLHGRGRCVLPRAGAAHLLPAAQPHRCRYAAARNWTLQLSSCVDVAVALPRRWCCPSACLLLSLTTPETRHHASPNHYNSCNFRCVVVAAVFCRALVPPRRPRPLRTLVFGGTDAGSSWVELSSTQALRAAGHNTLSWVLTISWPSKAQHQTQQPLSGRDASGPPVAVLRLKNPAFGRSQHVSQPSPERA